MPESDAESHRVTLSHQTVLALEELYPTALDRTGAIRMAVDEAIHRRRADREE